MMKLKVCGMKNPDNIIRIAELQPDYLGFIFYEASPRNFEGIIPKLPKSISKVGVFVNEYIEIVVSLVEEYQLDVVQLHGDESPEYLQELKVYLPKVEIIKVFNIKNEFNFEVLKPYENVVDYFLFDAQGKMRGGNGTSFNWSVLVQYNSEKPYFLSGGIGLDEIEKLKLFLRKPESKPCIAIDVNSKFETAAGVKSIEKIKKFKNSLKPKS